MSKGSRPRPFSVTQQEYEERWDAIFARPTQQELDEAKSKTESDIEHTEIKDSVQGG